MDSPEDSKTIADRLTKERYQILPVPTAYNNGWQWHSRTRPEPAYLAHRPRRLPTQHGAVGDGRPLPQKSASASGSAARQDPERDRTPYELKASPHLVDFLSPDDGLVATTLAGLVAESDADEEPLSEISAPVITPSTSDDGDPDPDSKGSTKVSKEAKLLYFRDWKSALSYKHGLLTDHNDVPVSWSAASLPPNNRMKWRDRTEERNTYQGL
ncbi:hypothetical protein FPANT_4475 [Fusarium pseudoanthophilum]|uniref:Uncharacterized protein n=1 Tax=Fusarium pseudoanthophilum TaxID=48495 RepID=A0A8H5PGD7_9HYPO|nr:hypothetical protein FPANT_4475 [Fusarium pseudoanthophilum]